MTLTWLAVGIMPKSGTAFAGVDLAFAKRKRLPICLVVWNGKRLEPLPIRRQGLPLPPLGQGNLAARAPERVDTFAGETVRFLDEVSTPSSPPLRAPRAGAIRKSSIRGFESAHSAPGTTASMRTSQLGSLHSPRPSFSATATARTTRFGYREPSLPRRSSEASPPTAAGPARFGRGPEPGTDLLAAARRTRRTRALPGCLEMTRPSAPRSAAKGADGAFDPAARTLG
jgi:hypothetical protein